MEPDPRESALKDSSDEFEKAIQQSTLRPEDWVDVLNSINKVTLPGESDKSIEDRIARDGFIGASPM